MAMAMAMAMARARMAISHCCNGIRQISVRRFEAGAGSCQKIHNSNKGSCSSEQPCPLNPFFHPVNAIPISLFGLWWYRVSKRHKREKKKEKGKEESNVRLRNLLEETGVNREYCEAEIAKIKQKIESRSASHRERIELEKYEMWLQLFTKGA